VSSVCCPHKIYGGKDSKWPSCRSAFIVLMVVNVGIGLWLIAHPKRKNSRIGPLLKANAGRSRLRVTGSGDLHTPRRWCWRNYGSRTNWEIGDSMLTDVVTIATRFGGSATQSSRGQRLSVLVDLQSSREPKFRAAEFVDTWEAAPVLADSGLQSAAANEKRVPLWQSSRRRQIRLIATSCLRAN